MFVASKPEQEIHLSNIPVFIALGGPISRFDIDIVLGIEGIFDQLDISFRKRKNQIILEG